MSLTFVILSDQRKRRISFAANETLRYAQGDKCGYVRNSYLSPLVREGRLQLTGAPNDPNVAYRSAH